MSIIQPLELLVHHPNLIQMCLATLVYQWWPQLIQWGTLFLVYLFLKYLSYLHICYCRCLIFNESKAMDIGCFYAGSSREFCGFNADTDDSIIKKIWERSCEYFPCLRKYSLELLKTKIRVGLRPWSE